MGLLLSLCPVRSVLVIGDSLIGNNFDGSGGFGQAVEMAVKEEWPSAKVDVVGVAGSNAGNWLYQAGHRGPQVQPGVMNRAKSATGKSINPAILAERNYDVVWVNLATNDANIFSSQRFAQYAAMLIGVFGNARSIIWTEGNYLGQDASLQKKKDALLITLTATLLTSDRRNVKVIRAASIDARPYVRHIRRPISHGQKLHPPLSVHRQWIEAAMPTVKSHVNASCASRFMKPLSIAAGIAAGIMVLKD